MNLKLMDRYIELCKEYNKPVTWRGLKLFNEVFK